MWSPYLLSWTSCFPARGRQVPVLRPISPAQSSSSSLCRTFHRLHQQHLHQQNNLPITALLRCWSPRWRAAGAALHFEKIQSFSPFFIGTILMPAWLSSTFLAQRAAVRGPQGSLTDYWRGGKAKVSSTMNERLPKLFRVCLTAAGRFTLKYSRSANHDFGLSEGIEKDVITHVLAWTNLWWVSEGVLQHRFDQRMTYSTSDKLNRVVVGETNQPSSILVAFISAE